MVKQIYIFLLSVVSLSASGFNAPRIVDVLREPVEATQNGGKVEIHISQAANIFMEVTDLSLELSGKEDGWDRWHFDQASIDLAMIPLASSATAWSEDDVTTIGATLMTRNSMDRYYFKFIKYWKNGKLAVKCVAVETVVPELANFALLTGFFGLAVILIKRRK